MFVKVNGTMRRLPPVYYGNTLAQRVYDHSLLYSQILNDASCTILSRPLSFDGPLFNVLASLVLFVRYDRTPGVCRATVSLSLDFEAIGQQRNTRARVHTTHYCRLVWFGTRDRWRSPLRCRMTRVQAGCEQTYLRKNNDAPYKNKIVERRRRWIASCWRFFLFRPLGPVRTVRMNVCGGSSEPAWVSFSTLETCGLLSTRNISCLLVSLLRASHSRALSFTACKASTTKMAFPMIFRTGRYATTSLSRFAVTSARYFVQQTRQKSSPSRYYSWRFFLFYRVSLFEPISRTLVSRSVSLCIQKIRSFVLSSVRCLSPCLCLLSFAIVLPFDGPT